jgi:hypothetical protein
VKFPFFLTADLGGNGQSPRSSRVVIEVARCTSDIDRDRLVHTLTSQGEAALRAELSSAQAVGSLQINSRLPWILRFARAMPQDGGGTRIFLATERPIMALSAWDDPRVTDYPFTVIDLLFERDGSVTGSLTFAARMSADEGGHFVSVENFETKPLAVTEVLWD